MKIFLFEQLGIPIYTLQFYLKKLQNLTYHWGISFQVSLKLGTYDIRLLTWKRNIQFIRLLLEYSTTML